MSDVHCRAAERTDFPAIKRIWAKAFGDAKEAEHFLDIFYADHGSYVLESDGRASAMAYLIYGGEYTEHGLAVLCPYLYAVAVDEPVRGQGYGKLITHYAVSKANEQGFRAVATCPETSSLVQFYRNLGFTRTELLGVNFKPDLFMIQNVSFLPEVLINITNAAD